MSTRTTTAVAAGAAAAVGLALGLALPIGAASTAPPTLAELQTKAHELADGLDALAAAQATPSPTVSPSPSDLPTSTPTPDVTVPSPSVTPTPPGVTPTPVPSTPGGSIGTLAWKPPALTAPTTITPKDQQGKITLAAGRDYVIKLPTDRPWKNARGLWVEGGRNVVVIGGQVDVGGGYFAGGSGPGVRSDGYVKRAAYFLSQTGTVHIEGVNFTSSTGDLSEGLNLSAARATWQVQNVRIGTPLKGDKASNHADCLQSWNGPVSLRVDGFSCTTGYQGMFLNAHDTSSASVVASDWELRNVEIVGTSAAKYILWVTSPPASVKTVNVYTSGGLGNWDAANDWPNVTKGRAPAPFSTTAGVGYVSPGYGP